MITLLASLSGFFGSLFPELLKYFFDKNDKKHELEVLKIQIEANKTNNNRKAEATLLNFENSEFKTLYSTYKSGIDWIDGLNAGVRPILAYAFFILYSYAKYMQYTNFAELVSAEELIELLWNIEDQAIFASVIGFYFGQRAFSKYSGRNNDHSKPSFLFSQKI